MSVKPIAHIQTTVENALAIFLLSVVWWAPNHQAPWGSFHHELLTGIAIVFTCTLLLWQTQWKFSIPLTAGIVFFMTLVPWLQWLGGVIPKSGTALISSAYIGALGLSICIGFAGSQRSAGWRLFDILFGALAFAAFVNVPVQLIQWSQWYDHDVESILMLLVTPIGAANRPSGMLLQPNQLATIQVWGLIGLTWFRFQSRITLPFFLLAFLSIVLGIGLTQSRSGLLEMVVVLALLILSYQSALQKDIGWTWGLAIAFLIVWGHYFAEVAEFLGVRSIAVTRLSSIDGARIDGWRAFWGAVMQRPWTGYGISDSGFAYVALAQDRPDIYIGQRFAHAHNAVMDIVVWVGLPLGLLVAGAFAAWIARQVRALPKFPQGVFPLSVLLSMGVHSMLELPHQFLYFIAPAGVCIGWLSGFRENSPSGVLTLQRRWWGAGGLAAVAVIAPIAIDYLPYQERYTEWRFENQRIGIRPDIAIHQPLVLNQLHDELVLYRLQLNNEFSTQQLDWIAKTAQTVNSPPSYFAAAMAFALVGQHGEAQRWMMRYNAIMGPEGVLQVKSIWRRHQESNARLASVTWPDYQGRRSTFVMMPLDASPKILSTGSSR